MKTRSSSCLKSARSMAGCTQAAAAAHTSHAADGDYLNMLSLELLCHILDWLPLSCIMSIEHLSRNIHKAVELHLRLVEQLDFTEHVIYGNLSSRLTDASLFSLLQRCPDLRVLLGFHPPTGMLNRRRQRGCSQTTLSVAGVIIALQQCRHLRAIETSDLSLLEAVLSYLPHIHIVGTFQNRDRHFPAPSSSRLSLARGARLVSLDLAGVVVPELPCLHMLQHLQLRWVRLTEAQPFVHFAAPLLRTFVMNNCAGPLNALKYVPLLAALAAVPSLARLELVRVPFLGGVIQHVVEDNWLLNRFSQIYRLVIGTCKHVLEVDIGYLMIACKKNLKELLLQPGLSKDSFFTSLRLAEVEFPSFETLHLGFVDSFPGEGGKWTNKDLVSHGLADVTESPAHISDVGMMSASQVLHNLNTLILYNCPHLHYPTTWFSAELGVWSQLRVLWLHRCHAIRLHDFCRMLTVLPCLESLHLEHMFREPPKGCSRVGLSAGTGLGVSSALVSNSAGGTPGIDNNPVEGVPAPVQPVAPSVAGHGDATEHAGASQSADSDGDGKESADVGRKCRRLSDGTRATDAPSYVGKGKSLRGRRKVAAKRSSGPQRLDCACQAVSEEIRESTKKARPSSSVETAVDVSTASNTATVTATARPIRGRQSDQHAGCSSTTSRPPSSKADMSDKATSTSDPVIEDDRVQVLSISSASLINVYLYYVGITDLVIKQAPALESLTGRACRVLRTVQLRHAPSLARISFTECRKLHHSHLIDEVCSQHAEHDRFISLQPMQNYDFGAIERQLFHSASYDFHVCLQHVRGLDVTLSRQLQQRAANWMHAMHLVNIELLKDHGFLKAARSVDMCFRYPWGRNIHRIYEVAGLENGMVDIVTDIAWLQTLINGHETNLAGRLASMDLCEPSVCIDMLADDIIEAKESRVQLHDHSLFIYVNLTDFIG